MKTLKPKKIIQSTSNSTEVKDYPIYKIESSATAPVPVTYNGKVCTILPDQTTD